MTKLKSIKISNHKIGKEHPPFIIAEMSGNHNHSLQRALELVEAASQSGAHAIKLQTYTADTMTLDLSEGAFLIDDPSSIWNGRTLYDLYQEAHTPWEWHKPIYDHCKKCNITFLSTPFDATAVDFLEELNTPCYKIASFENTDIPLIERVAATGKPLIISTGMASIAELDETVKAARKAGCNDLVLLTCTSTYPASPLNSNLRTIPHMRDLFDCEIGISDHTIGCGTAIAAIALGATLIEKHFTLNRQDGGVDALFSMEPHELFSLVKESKSAWQALGEIAYGPTEEELNSLCFRRSIYFIEDMQQGQMIRENNIRSIRPGFGLPPKFFQSLLGKKVNRPVKKGTPTAWNLLD